MYKKIILLLCLLSLGRGTFAQQRLSRVVTGAEHLVASQYVHQLEGKQVGVVANHTSIVGPARTHLVDTLRAMGIRVKTIFCPEHGFRGTAEAGAHVDNGVDAQTGIPVVSLYGKNKKPTADQLSGIDIIVFDLQDVGCRFYTYISTLHYVMEACAENHVPLMLLDRPNPNAHYVDGPVLEPQYQSFVGMHPVPIVYGMTIGEYATMINGENWLGMTSDKNKWVRPAKLHCQLTVVPLQNYTHHTPYVLPVPPSPNLPTPQAIALYPSLCLFEGTQISVGRGTEMPFEIVGSPSFHAVKTLSYPAITFCPKRIRGVSENPPCKGQTCTGVDLRRVTVAAKFDLAYLFLMYNNTPKYNFFLSNKFFDKLAGNASLRLQIQLGQSEKAIRASWEPSLDKFKKVRKHYLLYAE